MATSKVKILLQGDDQLSPQLKQCEASLQTLTSKADKLDKIQKDFDKITSSTRPLRQQLKQLQTIMADMNLNGLDNTPLFTEMAQHAGHLADAMGDARTAVNAFADDNFKLKAMSEGLTLVASAGSIATGAMGLFGTENEKVTQAILKVQSALAILNGVQAVANSLNKDSALMLRLKQIRMVASTKTTVADTVATSANSVSMGANTVATTLVQKAREKLNYTIAIGKALMGDWTGLLMVGAVALTTYAITTDNSKDSIEKESEATKKAKEEKEKYINTVASTTAKLVTKYNELKDAYSKLKTEADKVQWIKDNATEFDNLGIKINGLTDAENIFVNNTSKVVKALELRAQAAALNSLKEDAYTEFYKKRKENEGVAKAGSTTDYNDKELRSLFYEFTGLNGQVNNDNWQEYYTENGKWTEKGAKEFNRFVKSKGKNYVFQGYYDAENELMDSMQFIDAEGNRLKQEFDSLGLGDSVNLNGNANNKGGNDTTNKNKKNEVVDKDSIKYAEEQLKKFKDEKVKIPIDATDRLKENEDKINYWEKELERRKIVVELTSKYDDEKLKSLQSDLKKLVDERKDLKIGVDDTRIKEVDKEINETLSKLQSRKIEVFLTTNYDDTNLQGLKNHLKDLEDYQLTILIDDVETQKLISDEIEKTKKRIESTEIKLGIKPTIEEGSINQIEKEISDVVKQIGNIDPKTNPQKYQVLIDKLVALKKAQKEYNDEFERMTDIEEKASIYFEPKKLVKGSDEDKSQSYDNAMAEINSIGDKVAKNIISKDEAQRQIDAIVKQLQETIPDLELKVKVKEDGSIETIKKTSISAGEALGNIGSAVNSLGSSMQSLATDNEELAKSAAVMQAIGTLVLSFAQSMKGSVTVWDWIAGAVAGVATLTSVIAQMQSFNEGGIVQGSSYIGDRTLVRANAGEMILNRKQQDNLYQAIKNNDLGSNNMGGNVTFRIDGTTLKGVLNNTNRKIARQS